MRRLFFALMIGACVLSNEAVSQVNYSSNLDVANATPGEGDWDQNGFAGSGTNACSGLSMSDNCYGTGTSQIVEMYTVNSLGTALGGAVTVSFDYKMLDWNTANAAIAADFGSIKVYSAASALAVDPLNGGWTLQYTLNSHTASTSCATQGFTFTPPAGALHLLFTFEHSNVSSPDVDIYFDNISAIEATCIEPTVVYSIVPNCGAGQFSINANVTNLGDGTAVDLTDGGVTAGTSNVGTGNYVLGPYTAGDSIRIKVDGAAYGGCADSSAKLSEACACSNKPVATVNSTNLNCGTSLYDIEVTVTDFGDGTSVDIYIDNVLAQATATLSNLYTFSNYATGSHSVSVRASGAAFVTCNEDYSVSQSCNNDECVDAFVVTTDGTPRTSLDVTTYTSSGTNVSCDAGGGTEDAWYSFTAPSSGMVVIDIDDANLAGTNADIVEGALYDACAGTEVECFGWNNTNFFGSYNTGSAKGRLVTGLTAGAVYYLEIEHYNNDWTGTYAVSVQDYGPEIIAGTPVCLDLSDAFSLNDIGSVGEQFNCSVFSSPEFTGSDEEEYLFYTPASNQTVDIVLSAASYDDADGMYVGVFEWTPGTNATCLGTNAGVVIDGGNTTGQISDIALTAGTQYVIVVGEDYNDATSICVELRIQCGSVSTNSITASDCGASTYTGRVNLTSVTGAAVSYDLEDDDGNSFSGVSTSTNYDFSYTDLLDHTVTLKGYDGSMNLVCQDEVVVFSSGCNGTETCTGAPDITNACVPGDLTGAINEGTLSANPGCGNGTNVRTCAGGFSPSSNYEDIWYSIDNSGGSNTTTINFTGLTGSEEVIVFLYDGGCADANLLDHGYQNPVTTSVTAQSGSPGGTCAIFNSSNTSFTFYNLTAVSTIYVRVMPYVNASNCTGLVNADFTICATVPLPNDVSTGILQYVGPVTPYTVVNSAYDIEGNSVCQNMSQATVSGTSLPANCGGTAFNLGGNDLWYYVEIPDGQIDTRLELSITFDNAGESVYAIVSDGATSNQECTIMNSSAANETVVHQFDKTIREETSYDPNHYFIRLIQPATNGITSFCVSARLLVPNDKCEIFESTINATNIQYDLFDQSTNTPTSVASDFHFSSPSGVTLPSGIADPGHNDLWYSFDSRNFSYATDGDNVENVYSREVDININSGDLAADQVFTFAVYYNPAYSSGSVDCGNLGLVCYAENVTSLDFVVDGKITLPLDHLDGSYILRVIQTAGADSATFTISTNSSAEYGKPNSTCGIFGSNILAGPVYDITGATVNGDFDLAGLDCDRKEALWYQIEIPASSCPGITASTEVQDITVSFANAQSGGGIDADMDIVLYEDDCGTIVSSSVSVDTTLSGNNETDQFPVNTGRTYYLKVMPHDVGVRPTSFDVSAALGPVRPCNDRVDGAEEIASLTSGLCERASLPEYSAQGASQSASTVSGANDVWFKFTQPNNADEDGYLSILLINQTNGTGDNHTMSLEVYDGGSNDQVATRVLGPVTTNSQHEAQLDGGHMTVGKDYWIRVYHSELATEEVKYSICAYEAPSTAISCPSSSSGVTVSGAVECGNDCKQRYRIELPSNLNSGFWRFEVIANEPIADPLVFGQGSTSPSGEGSTTDYDLPCNPSMALADQCCGTNGAVAYSATASCPTPFGKYVVANLIGPSGSESNYYYLQVEHLTDLLGCGGIDVCEINVVGPFGSSADAATGNTGDIVTCSFNSGMSLDNNQNEQNDLIGIEEDPNHIHISYVQNQIRIKGSKGQYEVLLFDLNGKQVMKKSVSIESNEAFIETPEVVTGMYLVKVRSMSSFKSAKIIVD